MKKLQYIRPQSEIIRLNVSEAFQEGFPHGSDTVDSSDIDGKGSDFEEDEDGGLNRWIHEYDNNIDPEEPDDGRNPYRW